MPIDEAVRDEIKRLIDDVREYITYYKEMGIDLLPFQSESDNIGTKALSSVPSSLQEIREMIGDCNRCKLHNGRKNIVFGVGREDAVLVFIGEAPGRDEDIQAKPFVGRAGQLLTKIIKAMGLTRDDVYITNVVKCRPPQNRNPEPDEIIQCEEFLKYQLDIIKPDIICTLGKFAAQTLLKTNKPISRLRGNFYQYNGIKVMPTFHPAYLLRNPDDKKLTWNDIQMIMEEL
ncbi:MAG: uracil-DNA glycosylase family protein [Nitrospirota bacterium]